MYMSGACTPLLQTHRHVFCPRLDSSARGVRRTACFSGMYHSPPCMLLCDVRPVLCDGHLTGSRVPAAVYLLCACFKMQTGPPVDQHHPASCHLGPDSYGATQQPIQHTHTAGHPCHQPCAGVTIEGQPEATCSARCERGQQGRSSGNACGAIAQIWYVHIQHVS